MSRTVKVLLIVLAVVVGLFILPFVYEGFHSVGQQRALLNRTDYPQIVAACITIARATTNDSAIIRPSDPGVPALVRALSPRFIIASSNLVRMEFHGGFDHYGYRVRQCETNPAQWAISYYTEGGERFLAEITHE